MQRAPWGTRLAAGLLLAVLVAPGALSAVGSQASLGALGIAPSLLDAGDPEDLRSVLVAAAGVAGVHVERRSYAPQEASLDELVLELYSSLGLDVSEGVRADLWERVSHADEALSISLASVLGEILRVQGDVRSALAKASAAACETACSDRVWEDSLVRARMVQGSTDLLGAVERALPAWKALQDSRAGELGFRDPYGLVEVGSSSSDVFRGSNAPRIPSSFQVLTVDLGGDDVYYTAAGGTLGPCAYEVPGNGANVTCMPACLPFLGCADFTVSVAFDLEGDDTYQSLGGQGEGTRGVGILIDLDGDDRYTVSSGQGAALNGVGLLFDLRGNDTYAAGFRSQGYGAGGFGVLWDASGNDAYSGEWEVQGVGDGYALGLLLDGDGHDSYSALTFDGSCAYSQGASIDGGVGILADRAGLDTYRITCGGRGYVVPKFPVTYGLALFLDGQGLDLYFGAPGDNGRTWTQGIPYAPIGIGMDRS